MVIKGGVPIDMGVINNDQIGTINNIEKEFIAEAQAFALTLEDEGVSQVLLWNRCMRSAAYNTIP